MFIHWKEKRLVEGGYHRTGPLGFDTCAHDPAAGQRAKLTPVVKHSVREEGVSRHQTLWHPALGIRRCCIEDAEYPLVRVSFWAEVKERFAWLRKQRRAPHRKLVREAEPWVVLELAKVVPIPDAAEFEIALAWPDWPQGKGETVRDYLRRLYRLTRATVVGEDDGEEALSPDEAAGILGLSWPCTMDNVKAAYRKAALSHHPDQGGSHGTMVEVNQAMEVLRPLLR